MISFTRFPWAGPHGHFREGAIVEHFGDRLRAFVIGQTGQIFKSPQSAKEAQEIGVSGPSHDCSSPNVRRRPGERIAAAFPLVGIDEPGLSLARCTMALRAMFSLVCQRVMFSELLRLHGRPEKQKHLSI